MTFPETPLPVMVEMYANLAWTDITTDVYVRDGIDITRGRADEHGSAAPSTCSMTLNNRLGKYSPRNPVGAFYGSIGRNTPVRLGIGSPALRLDEFSSDELCSTPDSAGLTVTGDFDARIDLYIEDSWAAGEERMLIHKYDSAGQRSWVFFLNATGHLVYRWSSDGAAITAATSTEPVPGALIGRKAVRVSHDFDISSGNTVIFYTAEDMSVPDAEWTQLGSIVNTPGMAAHFDSTAPLAIGYNDSIGFNAPIGAVFSAKVFGGLGATTLLANPDFTAQADGVTSFADAQGNTWTVGGGATIVNTPHRLMRFRGEVSSWPAKWDTSGNDAYVPIEASGILRRIGQGSQPASSGLRQFIETTSDPNHYWPLTEGTSSTTGANVAAPAFLFQKYPNTGSSAPVIAYGTGDLGTLLPTGLGIANTEDGYVYAWTLMGASTETAVDFVFRAETLATLKLVERLNNGAEWELELRGDDTNDDVQVTFVDLTGESPVSTDLADTTALDAITDGQTHHVRFLLAQNGTDTDYTVYIDGDEVLSGTRTNQDMDGTNHIRFYYTAAVGLIDRTSTALGHVVIWGSGQDVPPISDVALAALGFAGETAGRRVERLCDELSVPFTGVGDLDDTLAMGPQYSDYFSNQLLEIEQTDLGILYEPRDALGVAYRTRSSLYNQDAAVTIDYSAGEIAPPFEPIDDDQRTRNDVFAQRREGGSYQVTQTVGRLSVDEPTTGVGRYKDEVTVNVETDAMLPEVGGWLVHLGTVDEARYPQITMCRHFREVVANSTLSEALLSVDVGDRLVITGTSDLNIYDDITQLVFGYTETLLPYEHRIVFNCAPASPYEVLELDDADSRVDAGEGSTLNAGVTSSATSLSVASDGFLWTTAVGDVPLSVIVGGEQMTVTAISGASSPQTFTVTRSVNGVTKAHSSGAQVRLLNGVGAL